MRALRTPEIAGIVAEGQVIMRRLGGQSPGVSSGTGQRELEHQPLDRQRRELRQALEVGAVMIGVNNRNLETLVIDHDTVSRIVPLVPAGCVAVAESGYFTPEDVSSAAAAGADAVLIGSAFSSAADPEAAVRLLSGISRRPRHG